MPMNCKPFHSLCEEYYKLAIYHFLLSVVCAALFALGIEFSTGSDGDDVIDYYIPAIVLSGIQFVLAVIALELFCVRTKYTVFIGTITNSLSDQRFARMRIVYIFLNTISCLWALIGAIITGTAGICHGSRSRCSYSINVGVNLALAIIIIVVHILHVVPFYFIFTAREKSSNQFPARISPQTRTNFKPTPKPNRNISTENRNSNAPKKETKANIDDKSLKASHAPRLERQYYDDSLIGRRLPKLQRADADIVKPLPKRNKKLLSIVGKVVVQLNSLKNKRSDKLNDVPDSPDFKLASSSNSSDDENEYVKLEPVNPALPRLPPPSYNDIISAGIETHANLTPPSRSGLYSGHAFPETELVVQQPYKY
ncbi:uncharacterized protein LOC132751911 [Ruditapes philippinarum]|uniref:uncharacterized protein LOC132751911 n=1 Tax=Ruditapes philippinarum TaxID=129788 RepID=UPI00295BF7DC|nr:uncharacterized protein LOC132751911 [Ruditapes philippinarum]